MQSQQKRSQKQLQLIERTMRALNLPSEDQARALLNTPRKQSFRINTLVVADTPTLLQELHRIGWDGTAIAWCPDTYTIDDGFESLRDSVYTKNGSIYIQNAASWLPVLALHPQPDEQILDICAAPGGKTSHIAQLTDNNAAITANDNSRARLLRLQANMQRMQATNIRYTLFDATQLSRKLPHTSFDKILLDAPCSGEGMMLLDNIKDFDSWSIAHIKRLQKLQKHIITQAWKLLKPGGTLIYSTCTMAPEENEAVVDYLLRHNPDASITAVPDIDAIPNRVPSVLTWNEKTYKADLAHALRLQASDSIEAFFVCRITKLEHADNDDFYRL